MESRRSSRVVVVAMLWPQQIFKMCLSCPQKELSLLMCGARNNRLSVVNLILDTLEEPNLEVMDSDEQTALYHAALNGYAPIVRTLIQAGADTNTKNKVRLAN